jgi:hypothetical protein
MGRSLTTNEESRWATPLSFLALSSSACWRRRKRASFFTYRCWRFQSSVWGRGTSLLDALKAQKNLWVFVIAASLSLFFHENFFRDFTCLDWFDPVDSSSTITCSFSWFFLFEVGGGRIIARWALWRLLCTFAVLEVLWGSFNRLLFPFLVCFFFFVVSLQGRYWNNKISFEDGSWGFLVLVSLFFGRLESSKSIPMKPKFVNAGVDLLLLQKILSF